MLLSLLLLLLLMLCTLGRLRSKAFRRTMCGLRVSWSVVSACGWGLRPDERAVHLHEVGLRTRDHRSNYEGPLEGTNTTPHMHAAFISTLRRTCLARIKPPVNPSACQATRQPARRTHRHPRPPHASGASEDGRGTSWAKGGRWAWRPRDERGDRHGSQLCSWVLVAARQVVPVLPP